MPDIAKCQGKTCPIKETCYRYTSKPSDLWQSYIMGIPYAMDRCEYFWKIKTTKVTGNS